MSPELQSLIDLQRIDAALIDARGRITAHPQKVAEADARLAEAKAVLDQAKDKLRISQEERRALEKDAAVFQGRLTKYKDQQSQVKTNREFQAMGHEIETATRELASAEEKVIEHMVGADALALEIKAAEGVFAARQKEIAAEKQVLAGELAEAEAALAKAQVERAGIAASLPPATLGVYERVAKQRKGIALAITRDGLCTACHVRMRPPVFQNVRANNSIIQCESCQRILYYVPPPAPVPPAVVVGS